MSKLGFVGEAVHVGLGVGVSVTVDAMVGVSVIVGLTVGLSVGVSVTVKITTGVVDGGIGVGVALGEMGGAKIKFARSANRIRIPMSRGKIYLRSVRDRVRVGTIGSPAYPNVASNLFRFAA